MTADERLPGRPSKNEAPILQRGLEAFAELGYEATTVRELATRLNVSHNYMNRRYGSKLDFWKAVVDAVIEPGAEELLRLSESDLSDESKFTAVVTAFYRSATRSPEMNRLIAYEAVRDSERLDYLYEKFIAPFWSRVVPIVDRLMSDGRMPNAPIDAVFFAITGPALAVTQGPLTQRLKGSPAVPVQDNSNTVEALIELSLSSLLPQRRADA
ncbi:TetR/AcrR family transcriptional regulator [Streptosporangium sp. 'caverna']|uniref:TetR/AcrR family transcriptional regulator n=1 Tax=Streptosporangium sp. 'caverna' TaxID=2202249 RepID=UPI000D7D4279|nr:TetR/AcrR family transcriptional regulator [Streptosporangium sp. 'caverna']AWS43849.1 TetR family transcriptional regulator [Streptosporangium sp. 'caverna']